MTLKVFILSYKLACVLGFSAPLKHSVSKNSIRDGYTILDSKVSWAHLDTKSLKNHLSGHPNIFHKMPFSKMKETTQYVNTFLTNNINVTL